MIWSKEKNWGVDYYIAELCEWLWEAFKKVQEQSTAEAKGQNWYFVRKANDILLEPGDQVLAKADAYKGKMKVKDWWEEEPYEVVHQVAEGRSPCLMKNEQMGCSWVLHQNWLFPIAPAKGTLLCTVI